MEAEAAAAAFAARMLAAERKAAARSYDLGNERRDALVVRGPLHVHERRGNDRARLWAGLLESFLWYRPGLCQCRFRRGCKGMSTSPIVYPEHGPEVLQETPTFGASRLNRARDV